MLVMTNTCWSANAFTHVDFQIVDFRNVGLLLDTFVVPYLLSTLVGLQRPHLFVSYIHNNRAAVGLVLW